MSSARKAGGGGIVVPGEVPPSGKRLRRCGRGEGKGAGVMDDKVRKNEFLDGTVPYFGQAVGGRAHEGARRRA